MSQATQSLDWAFSQLAKLRQDRPELVDTAIVRLMDSDAELRWSLVVSAYQDGEISLGKAAELLEMHALALRDRFVELGIPLRMGPVDSAAAVAEADALDAWLDEDAADGS